MKLTFKKTEVELRTPEEVREMTELLNSRGACCFITGGFSRDVVLGKIPHDMDIEVHGLAPGELKIILASSGYKVNDTGISFGVLKINDQKTGKSIDISVPRTDDAGRKPTVTLIENPTPALAAARRDFTINAIMYDTKNDAVIDPFQDFFDLERGYYGR